jgi:SAM-dependent methyltransferase
MESVTCNLCGTDDAPVLFQKKDKFKISREAFSIVKCSRCGLLYLNPRPGQEEIARFYPDTYSWKEGLEAGPFLTRLVRGMEKRYRYHLLKGEVAKVIQSAKKHGGNVLDVGCGTGDRLDVFRRSGFETFGVEISGSADYASKVMNLTVRKGDLFEANFPDAFFDVITLYHVLEHTHDPSGVCREICRVLKEDGHLVIQVPNPDSWQYRIFRERWAAFDVPRDLYYFNPKTLKALLEKAGLDVVKIDHFMNWWHPPTLVISLFPRLDPQKAWEKEGVGRTTLLDRILWILCTVTAGPLTQLESLMGRGAIVTYYARKRPVTASG